LTTTSIMTNKQYRQLILSTLTTKTATITEIYDKFQTKTLTMTVKYDILWHQLRQKLKIEHNLNNDCKYDNLIWKRKIRQWLYICQNTNKTANSKTTATMTTITTKKRTLSMNAKHDMNYKNYSTDYKCCKRKHDETVTITKNTINSLTAKTQN